MRLTFLQKYIENPSICGTVCTENLLNAASLWEGILSFLKHGILANRNKYYLVNLVNTKFYMINSKFTIALFHCLQRMQVVVGRKKAMLKKKKNTKACIGIYVCIYSNGHRKKVWKDTLITAGAMEIWERGWWRPIF